MAEYPQCPQYSPYQLCTANWTQTGGGVYGQQLGIYFTSSVNYAVSLEYQRSRTDNSVVAQYWMVTDPSGGGHRMLNTTGTQWRSVDGSGLVYDTAMCTLRDSDGIAYAFGCNGNGTSLQTVTDPNGNQIHWSAGTDSRGIPIPSLTSITPEGHCNSGTPTEQQVTPPGVSSPIYLCWGTVNYRTYLFNGAGYPDQNNGIGNQNEYVSSGIQIVRAVLPTSDAQKYEFDYTNAATAPYNYGELTKLTLPTGGYIRYAWGQSTTICGVFPVGGSEMTSVGYREVHESASATAALWQYGAREPDSGSQSGYADTGYKDPYGNITDFTFDTSVQGQACSYYPAHTRWFDSNHNLLKSRSTSYQWFPSSIANTSALAQDKLSLAALPISETTAWASGASKKTTYSYDSGFTVHALGGETPTVPFGKKTSQTEYAYGASSPGSALASNDEFFVAFSGPSAAGYLASNLLNLPYTTTATDNATTQTRSTVWGYNNTTQGNPTSAKHHLDTANADLETSYDNTAFGMLKSVTLPHDSGTPDTTTSYDYSSTYQGAVPTTITDSLSHATTATYDSASLRLLTSKDASNQTITYDYYGDGRLNHIYRPDGGVTTYDYPSANEVDETVKQNNSTNVVTKTFYDGLGRKIRTVTQGGCAGGNDISVEISYDLMDRVRSVTNPHCGSGSDGTTYYGSSNLSANDGYDALGRPILVTNPDGTTRTWTYNNRSIDAINDSVTITDEAGHTTTQITDALGHLVGVVDANGAKTIYIMNAFGDLTDVNQAGASGETARTRHFTYDSLGRLLTAQNPETGSIAYTYDNHSNVKTKTDARGVTISYSYDALNRLLHKTYSNGQANQWYAYDGKDEGGNTLPAPISTNAIGRLSHTSNGVNVASNYAYDVMGRLTYKADCLPSDCSYNVKTLAAYDLAGNMTGIGYPDGTAVTNVYDSAGRLSGVYAGTSAALGTQYVGLQYYPDGSPAMTTYGNGVVETRSENSRLLTCRLQVSRSGTNYLDRSYAFTQTGGGSCGAESNNNGNIWQITDNLPNAPYSQAMQYDSLNRLISWDAPNFANSVRHMNYSYDSFGNMVSDRGYAPAANQVGTVNARPFPNASYDTSTWPYDTNNRLLAGTFDCIPAGGGSSFYDLSGNVLCDGSNTNLNARQYRWDGDSRIAEIDGQPGSANTYYKTAVYAYDPEGQRVRADQFTGSNTAASSWREYAYLNGQVLAEHDQSGAWTDYIIANGKRIARIALGNTTSTTGFHFQGNSTSLGYQRLSAFQYQLGYYPNGIGNYVIQAGDTLEWQQYSNNVDGGFKSMAFWQCGGTYSLTDTNGFRFDHSPAQNTWTTRVVDLSSYVGCPFQISSVQGSLLQAGHWDLWISGLKVRHANGTTIMANSTTLPTLYYPDSGETGASVTVDTMTIQGPMVPTTTYTITDHLNTASLEFSDAGTLVWQGAFAPFGQELDNNPNFNRYKFTGKERDTESGLDLMGARYYASTMGRFMSPDPSGLTFANLPDPQSFNLYAYARNNPLINTDPSGLDCVYMNDNNDGVESIDHKSNSGECGDNGGTWRDGWVGSRQVSVGNNGNVNIAPVGRGCMQAAMRGMIAQTEGTDSLPNGGYGSFAGGGTITSAPSYLAGLVGGNSSADWIANPEALQGHPNVMVHLPRSDGSYIPTTAFGRYQIMARTAAGNGFTDFSPAGQDSAANTLMDQRHMITPAMNGDLSTAISRGANEWASLPGNNYGQGGKSMAAAQAAYNQSMQSAPECQ
ncbi:RHS repeat-associated core domain-containing protein [Terriglobus sp. RCC_193]|uniref:RHS repeat-associated core domain-containing protein n=1 Tax=Terriglobus sp. RCC_193 TaxID=3239218 RepID=UPI003526C2BA